MFFCTLLILNGGDFAHILSVKPIETIKKEVASPKQPYLNVTDLSFGVAKVNLNCPVGFIVVPGSATYNTKDFCVMKYEAKLDNNSKIPVSHAAGDPADLMSQDTAEEYSLNVASCVGCHLITESEWLTIAQNVMSVPVNWSGGVVGSGYIYSGHSDSDPYYSQAASENDSDGYFNTNNKESSNQRRTLALTNGEVIWDFAGNVWEWTSGQSVNHPGVNGNTDMWYEWKIVTTLGDLSPNPTPAFAMPEANNWTTKQGLGLLVSHADDKTLVGLMRGGYWGGGLVAGEAGIFALDSDIEPSVTMAGFRVAR